MQSDEVALSQSRQSLLNALMSAYTTSDSAIGNSVDLLFNNPRSTNPQVLFSLPDSQLETQLESERVAIGSTMADWSQAQLAASAGGALPIAQAESGLNAVSNLLADANTALNKALPGQGVTQTQLTTWTTGVATARTNVNAALSTLTAAETTQAAASSTLAKDQKTLALQFAGSTASTIAAQQAAVQQAQAAATAIQAQIRTLEIIAPFSGTITDTQGSVGENVTPDIAVVTLQPDQALDVKVNVSEDNVVGVVPGDPVRIELDAFPAGTSFDGKVSEVDPAQTVVGGAIYYQTTILFTKTYAGVRPGMTANVWIQTASSSDALLVPASAVTASGASSTVQLLQNGSPTTMPVSTGLKDQSGMVQILSGLQEGDVVVTGTN